MADFDITIDKNLMPTIEGYISPDIEDTLCKFLKDKGFTEVQPLKGCEKTFVHSDTLCGMELRAHFKKERIECIRLIFILEDRYGIYYDFYTNSLLFKEEIYNDMIEQLIIIQKRG